MLRRCCLKRCSVAHEHDFAYNPEQLLRLSGLGGEKRRANDRLDLSVAEGDRIGLSRGCSMKPVGPVHRESVSVVSVPTVRFVHSPSLRISTPIPTAAKQHWKICLGRIRHDLDLWLAEYNQTRPHSGKYCYGKTPDLFGFGSSGAGEDHRLALDSSAGAGAEPCAAERRRRRGRSSLSYFT